MIAKGGEGRDEPLQSRPTSKTLHHPLHAVAFLLQHYDFSADPAVERNLKQLVDQIHAFRKQVAPARNSFISHAWIVLHSKKLSIPMRQRRFA
jgi:hypothetical protein